MYVNVPDTKVEPLTLNRSHVTTKGQITLGTTSEKIIMFINQRQIHRMSGTFKNTNKLKQYSKTVNWNVSVNNINNLVSFFESIESASFLNTILFPIVNNFVNLYIHVLGLF